MESVASNRRQALNGTGAHHALPVSEHPGPSDSFDMDDGSFKGKPRTLAIMLGAMFVLGGMIAVALYRLNTIEAAVAELPAAIEKRIEQSEIAQEQTRKIACLQQQIANRNWTCPDAMASAPAPAQPAPKRRVAKKPVASEGFNPFDWTAKAGP